MSESFVDTKSISSISDSTNVNGFEEDNNDYDQALTDHLHMAMEREAENSTLKVYDMSVRDTILRSHCIKRWYKTIFQ